MSVPVVPSGAATFRPRSWRRTALWLVPAVVLLAFAERGARSVWAIWVLPTHGAQWIWAPAASAARNPVAFYAVRDVSLSAADWEPGVSARFLISVDEEYHLFVNARRVGSGSYAPNAALDQYEVGDLLVPGRNRIVIEARSSTGAGGLLASLFLGDADRPALRSDGSWHIVRRHQGGVIEGWVGVEAEESALVWQYPRTGRWGSPRIAGQARAPLPADQQVRWAKTIEQRPRNDGPVPFSVDFGEVVTGYLELWLEASPDRGYTLELGDALPPAAMGSRINQSVQVCLVPERSFWRDTSPRRFRYAWLAGVDGVAAARAALLPVAAADTATSP